MASSGRYLIAWHLRFRCERPEVSFCWYLKIEPCEAAPPGQATRQDSDRMQYRS